jgi:hypothetical protein
MQWLLSEKSPEHWILLTQMLPHIPPRTPSQGGECKAECKQGKPNLRSFASDDNWQKYQYPSSKIYRETDDLIEVDGLKPEEAEVGEVCPITAISMAGRVDLANGCSLGFADRFSMTKGRRP